eukprot:SAG31_NODE_201_length_20535_cov_15.315081_24_plen_94_part_00
MNCSLGLKRLTDLGEFVVGMDKREAHHRNVWLLGSSFDAPHPGRKIGRRMQSDELAADVAAGWTAVHFRASSTTYQELLRSHPVSPLSFPSSL